MQNMTKVEILNTSFTVIFPSIEKSESFYFIFKKNLNLKLNTSHQIF